KDKKTDPSQANREEETNLSKDKDVQNHNEEVDEVEVDSSNNEAESSISAEEQEELLKKYDAESNTRDVKGIVAGIVRSEEHTSELQSRFDLVCRLLLEKKKK